MELFDIHIATRERFEIENGHQPYSSLFYLLAGNFEIELDGILYAAQKGDAIYLPRELRFKRKVTETIRFYYLRFSGDEAYSSMGGVFRPRHPDRFEGTLALLLEDVESPMEAKQIKSILLESIFCAQKIEEQNRKKRQGDPRVQKCIDYIANHFWEDIDLELLHQLSGYSKTALIEKFKQHHGVTPIGYLHSVRMNAAKQELVNSNASIAEIAERCGFHCPYYFSNAFKKQLGQSPNQYRKKFFI